MSDVIAEVSKLGKRYGAGWALNQVSLHVKKGELFGLVGPDGSGKSSVLKALAGVLSYDAGSVAVFGQTIDSAKAAEKIKARIGFMPQGLGQNLYRDLSVEENIDFFAKLRRVDERALATQKARLLQMTRLTPFKNRPMKKLSGGMKQKLGLICTLIHSPELIILDEPTTGVDPVSRSDFWWILSQLIQEQQVTAIVSTAYMDEAVRFDRCAIFNEGQVLALGRVDEINASVAGQVVAVQATPAYEALKQLQLQFEHIEVVGDKIRVYFDAAECAGAEERVIAALQSPNELSSPIEILSTRLQPPELEDAFLVLVTRDSAKQQTSAQGIKAVEWDHWGENHLSTNDQPVILAEHLTQQFGDFRAVDNVSFQVKAGEIFGLLGANGAGKTTVIKMLTGILQPTGGNGAVAGQDMRYGKEIKRRIGYMSQAFSLYLDMTALENLRLYASIYSVDRDLTQARIDWILTLTGLSAVQKQMAANLPVGMRQRLALGCALIHQPSVLFLDEPTSGVDPIGRRQFWDILFQLSRRYQVTILVTTHYMAEAEHCDHLAIMYAGRIIADNSPAALKEEIKIEAGALYALETADPFKALKILQQNGFEQASLYGQRIHVHSHAIEDDQQKITALLSDKGLSVLKLYPISLSMEDLFVRRIRQMEANET
jgi:ABC-type multidrug transport system ATPase subunit